MKCEEEFEAIGLDADARRFVERSRERGFARTCGTCRGARRCWIPGRRLEPSSRVRGGDNAMARAPARVEIAFLRQEFRTQHVTLKVGRTASNCCRCGPWSRGGAARRV